MEWKMTLLNEREKGRAEGREEGRAEGRAEGKEEGREEGTLLNQILVITKKVQKGSSLSAIAEALEMPEEEVRPIWEVVKEAAPDYDSEKILQKLRE